MRILLLVQNYFPNTQSCAKIMHHLASQLRDYGHDVVIVAPDHSLKVRRTISCEDQITVLRVRSGRFRGVPLPVRAYHEWSLPSTLWRGAGDWFREHTCQLIVTYSPPVFFGPLVRRLKRIWGCTTYLVLRDIFPQWTVDAGVVQQGSLIYRLFRHYELLLYATADVIGVQSVRNLDYFRDESLTASYHLEVLHNWAPVRGQEVARTQLRRDLDLQGRVVFLYGGNLGVAQDVMSIVRLADAVRHDPRAFFLVIGDGSEAARLLQATADLSLENLRFLPTVDLKTYLGIVSECDVGLLTLSSNLRTHNFPGKMLDYIYFGKPILAAVNPGNDLQNLLEEHAAGLVSVTGQEVRFYDHAVRLVENSALRQHLGRNGRAMLEQVFSPERAARQILASAASCSKSQPE